MSVITTNGHVDGLSAYRKGYKGQAEHLKGKESLTEAQKRIRKEKTKDDEDYLRDVVIRRF